jgi:chromosome segregation ATPase
MPETRRDGPRFLYEKGAPNADPPGTMDVMDLLTRLAERTEELAEARVRQKHAEADLKGKTRELASERKARDQARKQLETDRRELEAEYREVAAECRDLEAELARERKARTADGAELKRVQYRVAALQQQLQIAWAQLQESGTEGAQRSWWSRLGS